MPGIVAGSRSMFEYLNLFLSVAEIHPVVDRVFPLLQVREVYEHLRRAGHFGKVVIEVES